MIHSDRAAFGEIMRAMCTTFDRPVSDPLLDIYFSALDSLTFAEFKKAANTLLLTSRFFPKPVDFLEAASGSLDDQAQHAWLLLCEALGTLGWARSLFIEDVRLAYAMEQTFGGWIQCAEQLGPLTPSDPMYASLRKSFVMNFGLATRNANLTVNQDRYFASICEVQNRENISQWRQRDWPMLDDGTPYFTQSVGAIRDGRVVEMEGKYSATTARLTTESERLLLGTSEQRQLIAAK